MGRHTADPLRHRIRAGLRSRPVRFTAAVVAVVAVLGAGVLIDPTTSARLPWAEAAGSGGCRPREVRVLVAPELESLVGQILTPKDAAGCVDVRVQAEEPQQTLAGAGLVAPDQAPQLWIPDSTVWGQRAADDWPSESAGSLAETPVVIATSAKAAEQLGWSVTAPSWEQALHGSRPVAVPDYRARSESIEALLALWQTLGKGERANDEVLGAVLAADRQEVPAPDAALADAESGTAMAPLLPSTEQAVAAGNAVTARTGSANLVAVYPREGSPVLNYPILKIDGAAPTPALAEATQSVISRLTAPRAALLMRRAGFRGPDGAPAQGTGIRPDVDRSLQPPSRADVQGMIDRIDNLAAPSRILTVMDVSESMRAELDDGITRIAVEGEAVRLGTNVLPDRSYVGVWQFSSAINGVRAGTHYRELLPVRRLGSRDTSGETQRNQLMRSSVYPEQYLAGGEAPLFDVTISALRSMHQNYDPKAANAIIVLSGGQDDHSTGPGAATLTDVLHEISKLNRDGQNVAIYTAGLGPDADYAALGKIAEASGGHPYRIDTALQGQRALLDGLNRSRRIGAEPAAPPRRESPPS